MGPFKDIGVETSGFVSLIEIRRPPNNFFDIALIHEIAGALEALDQDAGCRAVVLASQGKAFCAGANFGDGSALDRAGQRPGEQAQPVGHLYIEAVRLFRTGKPIIGAIHGAAVGGGLGLALVADFRVTCPEARFCANFTRLGFHPGFGLTATLPEVIGKTNAALMFYTSRRVTGEEAYRMGLADVLVAQDQVRAGGAQARRRDRRERAARRGRHPGDHARRSRRPRAERQPSTSWRSRAACARPTTSRKASRPCPSVACRISPAAKWSPQG